MDLQFDQKGVLNVLHHIGEMRNSTRRVEANHLQGIDAEMLDAEQVKEFCPIINISPDVRYPVIGGALQRRGGTARHDRIAWALATRASERGVDIVEHAEVTRFLHGDGFRHWRQVTRAGPIRANKMALVAAEPPRAGQMVDAAAVQSHPLRPS
jgi:sarcosine oxidase subunit beta